MRSFSGRAIYVDLNISGCERFQETCLIKGLRLGCPWFLDYMRPIISLSISLRDAKTQDLDEIAVDGDLSSKIQLLWVRQISNDTVNIPALKTDRFAG